MSDCIFCKIAEGEIPSARVYEDEVCIAFNDLNPQAPTHILVIPRKHIASLNEASDAALVGEMHLLAAEIAKTEGLAERGYRAVINTNADAGQTVFHVKVRKTTLSAEVVRVLGKDADQRRIIDQSREPIVHVKRRMSAKAPAETYIGSMPDRRRARFELKNISKILKWAALVQ